MIFSIAIILLAGRCLTFFTLNKPVQIILPLFAAFILYSAEDFLSVSPHFSGLIAIWPAILITAPLGAFLIGKFYKKLLY